MVSFCFIDIFDLERDRRLHSSSTLTVDFTADKFPVLTEKTRSCTSYKMLRSPVRKSLFAKAVQVLR